MIFYDLYSGWVILIQKCLVSILVHALTSMPNTIPNIHFQDFAMRSGRFTFILHDGDVHLGVLVLVLSRLHVGIESSPHYLFHHVHHDHQSLSCWLMLSEHYSLMDLEHVKANSWYMIFICLFNFLPPCKNDETGRTFRFHHQMWQGSPV